MARENVELVDAELVHHLDQPAAADIVARGKRMEVAHHLHGLAHVRGHDIDQRPVHLSVVGEAHDGDVRSLPRRCCARPTSARARRCRRHGWCWRTAPPPGPSRNAGVTKVKSCRCPVPFHGSLVRNTSPSFIVSIGNRSRRVADRARHRIDVPRRAGHRLGEHPPLGVETRRPTGRPPPGWRWRSRSG